MLNLSDDRYSIDVLLAVLQGLNVVGLPFPAELSSRYRPCSSSLTARTHVMAGIT